MYERAHYYAEDMGPLRNSIKQGAGNEGGFLGEEAVLMAYPRAKRDSTYDYDIDLCGFKIDVKTKETDYVPQSNFDVSIPILNTKQACDFYLWTVVSKKNQIAYILGYITKELFFKGSVFWERGQVDYVNGFTEKVGSYKLKVADLWPPEELLNVTPYRVPRRPGVNIK